MNPDSEYWHGVGVGYRNIMIKSNNYSKLI